MQNIQCYLKRKGIFMDKNLLYIMYGSDPKSMVQKALEQTDVLNDIPSKDSLIGIKPNLVVAKPAELGATTSPDLVEGLIQYLQSNAYHNLIIMEGSWVGDRTPLAFQVCGYEELSKKRPSLNVDGLFREYADKYIRGIDFNPDLSRVAKMNMVLNDDGHTGIFHFDSLTPFDEWPTKITSKIGKEKIEIGRASCRERV